MGGGGGVVGFEGKFDIFLAKYFARLAFFASTILSQFPVVLFYFLPYLSYFPMSQGMVRVCLSRSKDKNDNGEVTLTLLLQINGFTIVKDCKP